MNDMHIKTPDTSERAGLPALTQSRAARFTAVILLYFMQGLPAGLSLVAMPAWLAANGATPLAVGAFVGTSILAWPMKPFIGLVMDRLTFRPMGRRRVWILLAQSSMVLSAFALAVAAPSADEIGTLAAFMFTLNLCAVFNDVATDGMTVDLVHHDERTVINGFMLAAQTSGIASAGFVGGQFLASGKLPVVALGLAAVAACASVFVSLFRERPGERLLPWTAGKPSPECEARQHDAWRPIIRGVFRTIFAPLTLLFLAGFGLTQATPVFTDAVAPTLAVQHLGWQSNQYSSYVSMIGLCAAAFGAVFVPLAVKLMGLRATFIVISLVLALTALLAGASYNSWQGGSGFAVIFAVQYIFTIASVIVGVVWAMRICNPAIGASLFALIMASPNLSRSVLSGWSGWIVDAVGYAGAYYVVSALTFLGLAFYIVGRVGGEGVNANNITTLGLRK